MSTSVQNYLFTIQYTGEPPVVSSTDAVLEHASYMVYQSEMAPTTGQLHLQGFVHFKSKKRPMGAKEIICSLSRLLTSPKVMARPLLWQPTVRRRTLVSLVLNP